MTERDNLIITCEEITNICASKIACNFCNYHMYRPLCTGVAVADHLLKKGFIFSPCKVGDSLFTIAKVGVIMEHEIIQIRISENGVVFDCISKTLHGKDFCFSNDLIGKTAFLTRKEAEKALAKITENK